jgi:hypothetical protein
LGGDAVGEADVLSRPGEFDRIVILASTGDGHPEQLQGRKLFIVARDDQGPSGPRLAEISESYAKVPQPKKLIVLDGSAYAQFLFDVGAGPSLMKTIQQFLSEP